MYAVFTRITRGWSRIEAARLPWHEKPGGAVRGAFGGQLNP